MVGGLNTELWRKSKSGRSLTISGIAMSRPIDVTSFAMAGAVRRCRYSARSRIRPTSGATMNTDKMNAGSSGQSWLVTVL